MVHKVHHSDNFEDFGIFPKSLKSAVTVTKVIKRAPYLAGGK